MYLCISRHTIANRNPSSEYPTRTLKCNMRIHQYVSMRIQAYNSKKKSFLRIPNPNMKIAVKYTLLREIHVVISHVSIHLISHVSIHACPGMPQQKQQTTQPDFKMRGLKIALKLRIYPYESIHLQAYDNKKKCLHRIPNPCLKPKICKNRIYLMCVSVHPGIRQQKEILRQNTKPVP